MRIFGRLIKIVLVCAAVLGPGFSAARAAGFPVEPIQKDLSVQQARVIAGPGGKMLVSRGSGDGVQKGDLFCIYEKAQPVTDPQTGEKLGSYAAPAAIGRVVRVSEKFAEIRIKCLAPDCSVSSGRNAVRFSDVPARFMDAGGVHFSDYTAIRAALPHLDWRGYDKNANPAAAQEASAFSVVFAARGNRLTLWSGGEIRAVYTGSVAGQEAGLMRSRQAGESGLDFAGRQQRRRAPGVALPSLEYAVKAEDYQGVVSRDEITRNIGVVRAAGSQTPFLLTLGERTVEARALEGDKRFSYSYEGFGRVVNMSVSGQSMAALNVYVPEAGMRSVVLELTDSGFREVAKRVPYVLSFMGSVQNGQEPELWGQRFSLSERLLPVVFRLHLRKNGSVERGEELEVPAGFNLFGAFYADLNGNGSREYGFFNPGGRMVIYESGKLLWESAEQFAPSLDDFQVQDPADRDAAPARVEIWSGPALFRLGDTVFAAAALNQAVLERFFGGSARAGTVGILQSIEGSYQLRMLADDFEGGVRDVHYWKDRLLICVSEGSLLAEQGRSHVLALPIAALGLTAASE